MDYLCVALDTENIQARVTIAKVRRDESLLDAMLRVVVDEWEWSPEDMERLGDCVEYFLIDPDAWKWLKRIRWPGIRHIPDEPVEMLERGRHMLNLCRIRTYRACRMHWSHARYMHHAKRLQAAKDDQKR